jgi:hypothetical protein
LIVVGDVAVAGGNAKAGLPGNIGAEEGDAAVRAAGEWDGIPLAESTSGLIAER